jgi:hypothetical protein
MNHDISVCIIFSLAASVLPLRRIPEFFFSCDNYAKYVDYYLYDLKTFEAS